AVRWEPRARRAPEATPAPIAARALQVIERRLPPRAALTTRPAANEAWLKRAGTADLMPAAEQQRLAATAGARPLPAGRGSGGLPRAPRPFGGAHPGKLLERGPAARPPGATRPPPPPARPAPGPP